MLPMNNCPFVESIKALLATGNCREKGCPLGKVPPVGHLLIAGAIVFVFVAVLSPLFSPPRRP